MEYTLIEIFNKMNILKKSLDCSYPSEKLSEIINFNDTFNSGVDIYIGSNEYNEECFVFMIHSPYERSEEVEVDIQTIMEL